MGVGEKAGELGSNSVSKVRRMGRFSKLRSK